MLFEQTGASDWEAAADAAPPVSDEVRLLLEAGEQKRAAELYMRETGAGIGEAARRWQGGQEIRAGGPRLLMAQASAARAEARSSVTTTSLTPPKVV